MSWIEVRVAHLITVSLSLAIKVSLVIDSNRMTFHISSAVGQLPSLSQESSLYPAPTSTAATVSGPMTPTVHMPMPTFNNEKERS